VGISVSLLMLLMGVIERSHTIDRQPFAPVLAFRQLYAFPQTVSTQSRIGKLLQLPCARALSTLLALESLSIASIGIAAREDVSLVRDLSETIAQAALSFV
jgi:hypothetical protein